MNTITTTALNEKLNETAANAAQAVIAARREYEQVALSFHEGTAAPEALANAAQAIVDAERDVANVAAAKAGQEARQALLAEEAKEFAETAQRWAIHEQMQQIAQAAESWDQALDELVEASERYATISRELHGLRPDQSTIRRIESARGMAIDIIGYRLAAFVGDGYRPPFFPPAHGRLSYHIPRSTE